MVEFAWLCRNREQKASPVASLASRVLYFLDFHRRCGKTLADAGRALGIALAMAIGSYAAGSTPMGGGTVGFPVLVCSLAAPTLGRDF